MQEFLTPSSDVPANLTESPGLSQPEGEVWGTPRGQGRFAACPCGWVLEIGRLRLEFVGGRGAGALPGWKNGVGSEKGEGKKETIGK